MSLMSSDGLDEAFKERVRPIWPRQKLRVELASDHEWMIAELGDFHEFPVRRETRINHPMFSENFAVGIVELIAMPMALKNRCALICTLCQRTFHKFTGIESQSHKTLRGKHRQNTLT